ncbi:MAG: hypothetical protein PHF76_12250 [Bacteroidales bacterium]|jgi:hypothetical protein|nr:hypothetical protein [Bacteroidales bacterium]MDD3915404.1 hypothetical protein [Bacteroidales bacterium]
MNNNGFHDLICGVIEQLELTARTNPKTISSCKSGDDFEMCVVNAVQEVLTAKAIEADVLYTPGSHTFPDIIIRYDNTGEKYGIEVKSSSAKKASGWKINGNSVMGSTRDNDVIETYIIFGKTAESILEFKARKYEDCVANVVVTHSPRYLIDMDLPEGETFFEKSGIEYKQIVNSDNPIGLITKYFQAQGQKAWWLAESTPAAVRMFTDISIAEQNECFGYGLAHFPELFERNSTKYKRLAMWMATERSVVASSLRDDFSAGGQVSMIINGTMYNKLPQIYKRLLEYKNYLLKALEEADAETLCDDWGCDIMKLDTIEEKVKAWINVVAGHVCQNQLLDDVKPLQLLQDIIEHSDSD